MNKKKSERIHFTGRLQERFGIKCTQKVRDDLIHMIKNHKTIHSEKQSNRITRHTIEYNDEILTVIYDKIRKELVTVY